MKRMIDTGLALNKPKLVEEKELTGTSSVMVDLAKGTYWLEAHSSTASNIALITISEEPISLSNLTVFDTTVGYYSYSNGILRIKNAQGAEAPFTAHLDIYKF